MDVPVNQEETLNFSLPSPRYFKGHSELHFNFTDILLQQYFIICA